MEVIPAIDIRGGRCVRLYQGDYSQETVFSQDPVAMSLHWKEQGARQLHLVDLDGAATGEVRNLEIITDIVKQSGLPAELGGGIRNEAMVKKLLDIGIQRVVLGTAAIEHPELAKDLCRKFSEAIVIGIDARDGYATTHGWTKDTRITATELGQRMANAGARRIIYTDVKRDGTLSEPNFEATADMVRSVNLPVIAAGGISAISHLKRLKQVGVEGVIIGRALYTGNIDLRKALAAVKDVRHK